MNEDITIKGLWWLAETPEKKIAGEITYGPATGSRLSVFDYFFQGPRFEPFTVWGITAKGKPLSLFNCRTTNFTCISQVCPLPKLHPNWE